MLLAVNPTSGSGRGAAAGGVVADALHRAGVETHTLIASSAAGLRDRVQHGLDDGARALVVVGGDGMVHLGVTLVAGTGVPLGVVASGTGNDNARELGFPVTGAVAGAEAVVGALASGGVRSIDAVRWTTGDGAGGWFAGVLGAGFDAVVNERANGWQRLKGRIRYDLAIVRELPVFRPLPFTLELDGERSAFEAVLVAVGNGPAYGGGMQICAGASMDDGVLDVVVAGPLSRSGLIRLYPKVYSGAHLKHPAVRVLRGARLRLDSPGIVAYADGERLGPLPLTCEVVPGALTVVGGVSGGQ